MEKKDTKEIMKQIIDMQNNVDDLYHNTLDAEMGKYFLGFKEGLDWVVTDVLR